MASVASSSFKRKRVASPTRSQHSTQSVGIDALLRRSKHAPSAVGSGEEEEIDNKRKLKARVTNKQQDKFRCFALEFLKPMKKETSTKTVSRNLLACGCCRSVLKLHRHHVINMMSHHHV